MYKTLDQTMHVILLRDSMGLLQKLKSGTGSPDWNVSWLTSTFKNSCGCTALDMAERREMTKLIVWWAKRS